MIINKSTYNYHGTVKSLYSGLTQDGTLKYTVIKAFGQCEVEDEGKASGRRLAKQDITIFTHGALSTYVDSEISEGDKIMVVGKIITKQRSKGGVFYYEQCIQADEVYRNEWVKYYKGEKK